MTIYQKRFVSILLVALFGILDFGVISAEQTRECSCAEQNQYFGEIKKYVSDCFHQCNENSDLKSVIETPSIIYPCLDMKLRAVNSTIDCFNSKYNAKQSCVFDKNGPQINKMDSSKMFSAKLEPMVEKLQYYLGSFINGKKLPIGKVLLDVSDCSRKCAFKKFESLSCSEKFSCEMNMPEEAVKPALLGCLLQNNFKKIAESSCECIVKSNANNAKGLCNIVAEADFDLEIA